MLYFNGQLLSRLGVNLTIVDEATLNKLIISNELYNNKKMNDENNVFYHKGYKMLFGTEKLSEDKKSITIELRDADLEHKAIDNYEIGDLVNLEASSSLYQRQKIAQLSTSPETKNTIITLVEVEEDAEISFKLEAKEAGQTDEDYEKENNWIWVLDKSVGEDIPSFAYATASGHNTHAIGHGAFSTGCNNKVHGHYGAVFGKENLALFCALATGLYTKALGIRAVTLGCQTVASGTDSLAMGAKSKAYGMSSFAGGDNSKTNGQGSLAYGLRATANADYQVVFGKDNIPDDSALLIVGNGTYGKKSNAFVVNKNGTATIKKDPVNNMDVATKQYVDRLEKEIEILKQAIINLGGVING